LRFLKHLRENLQTNEKAYIVLDRHTAHKSNDTKQLAQELNFELLYMPPGTPELNSIEALWSVIKRDFKNRAETMTMVRMSQEEFEDLLIKCLDDVTPGRVGGVDPDDVESEPEGNEQTAQWPKAE